MKYKPNFSYIVKTDHRPTCFCVQVFTFPCYQGAMAGLGVGLALAFWIGIGSIVTGSSSTTQLPPHCRANLLSVNTTTAIQTALSNITLRYRSYRQHSVLCLWSFYKSLFAFLADPLD